MYLREFKITPTCCFDCLAGLEQVSCRELGCLVGPSFNIKYKKVCLFAIWESRGSVCDRQCGFVCDTPLLREAPHLCDTWWPACEWPLVCACTSSSPLCQFDCCLGTLHTLSSTSAAPHTYGSVGGFSRFRGAASSSTSRAPEPGLHKPDPVHTPRTSWLSVNHSEREAFSDPSETRPLSPYLLFLRVRWRSFTASRHVHARAPKDVFLDVQDVCKPAGPSPVHFL